MGKYDALFDDEEKPAAPAPAAGKYAALFDDEPAPAAEPPGLLSRIGTGIVETGKSVGRGISKGADLISPISNPGPGITDADSIAVPGGYRLHAPFSQLMHPDYRREAERGASRAIPGNPAEKLTNYLSPDYAAASEPDALANPGASDMGSLAMSSAFNPMVSASVGAAKAAAAGAANKAVDRIAVRGLDKIAEGGAQKARIALGKVKGNALDMLKENPALAEGKTVDVAKNFANEGSRLSGEREKLFNDVDAVRGGGAPMPLIAKHVDETIEKLKTGTQTERDVAKAMVERRDKLFESHGADGSLSSSDLRRQISDYQNAYDKTASNVANRADKEMSKAMHGALEEHVGGPAAYAKIKSLTDKMSVATRAQKLLDARAGKEAAPGATSSPGLLGGIARDIKHSHTTMGAAAKVAHRVSEPMAQLADKAIAGAAEGAGNAVTKSASVIARYLQLRRAGRDQEAAVFAEANGI